MGLDYLNKKTWHTASIKNIAKVWEREQKELRKYQKQDEYNKKLLEEQHAHELKIAQVEAGLIPKSALDKMEWMYNPVLVQAQNTEQYLLGKPVDLKEMNKSKQQDPQDNSNKYQAIVTEDVTNKTCENFTLIHEDPLFKIMQEELKMKEKLLNNPLDMVHLLSDKMKGISKKKSKKHKKEKDSKKHKKHRKSSAEREKKHKDKKNKKQKEKDNRSRSRSQKKDKKKQARKDSLSSSSSESSASVERERSRSKQRRNRSNSYDDRSTRATRNDSRSVERKHTSRRHRSRSRSISNSPSSRNHHNRKQKKDASPLRESRRRSRSRSASEESKMKQSMYEEYLKKKVGNILVRSDDGQLRPDFGLMKRKFRNNLKPEEKLKMTEAEKKEMLAEMQNNAKQVAEDRKKEFADDYTDDLTEQSVKDIHSKQNNPKFMDKINQSLYSTNKDINSLSDQINKSKMNFKRNIEESNTFK